jgi:flagellar biosynthesis protein FlhB
MKKNVFYNVKIYIFFTFVFIVRLDLHFKDMFKHFKSLKMEKKIKKDLPK